MRLRKSSSELDRYFWLPAGHVRLPATKNASTRWPKRRLWRFLGQDRRCVLWNLTSCYCNCHLSLKVSPKNQERATKGWNSFLCHFRCLSRNYETLPFVVRTCCSGESSPRTHKERQYLDCSWIVAMRWALFSHDDNYHPNENLTFNLSMKIELIAIKFQVITKYSTLSLHIHHASFFRVTNIFPFNNFIS